MFALPHLGTRCTSLSRGNSIHKECLDSCKSYPTWKESKKKCLDERKCFEESILHLERISKKLGYVKIKNYCVTIDHFCMWFYNWLIMLCCFVLRVIFSIWWYIKSSATIRWRIREKYYNLKSVLNIYETKTY